MTSRDCIWSFQRRQNSNMVADRAHVHSHLNTVDLSTDQTDLLTDLKTACRRHWDMTLTDALSYNREKREREREK